MPVADVVIRRAVPADLPAVQHLLRELDLPLDGVEPGLEQYHVADQAGRLVGVAGIELYPDGALLRSVAVAPAVRGTGLAAALVGRSLELARKEGVRDVFLLTTTAERYFPRLGFTAATRDDVPEGVRGSVEFRQACPASAAVMRKKV